MSETQHTPGPWIVGISADNGIHCVDAAREGNDKPTEICEVWGTKSDKIETAESWANARLISAAPDYHRAAMLFDSWQHWPEHGPEVDFCTAWFRHHKIESDYTQPIDYIHSLFRDAIAKATRKPAEAPGAD